MSERRPACAFLPASFAQEVFFQCHTFNDTFKKAKKPIFLVQVSSPVFCSLLLMLLRSSVFFPQTHSRRLQPISAYTSVAQPLPAYEAACHAKSVSVACHFSACAAPARQSRRHMEVKGLGSIAASCVPVYFQDTAEHRPGAQREGPLSLTSHGADKM
jgi:hypothetical protein